MKQNGRLVTVVILVLFHDNGQSIGVETKYINSHRIHTIGPASGSRYKA